MGVSQQKFDCLLERVAELELEVSEDVIRSKWGTEYPTVYGEINAIKDFLGITTKIEKASPAKVKMISTKKVSKK